MKTFVAADLQTDDFEQKERAIKTRRKVMKNKDFWRGGGGSSKKIR